jgi:hypothetical protein
MNLASGFAVDVKCGNCSVTSNIRFKRLLNRAVVLYLFNYFALEYLTMVRVITQGTFDEVVKENMEEFSMSLEEAIKEAVEQFEAQV